MLTAADPAPAPPSVEMPPEIDRLLTTTSGSGSGRSMASGSRAASALTVVVPAAARRALLPTVALVRSTAMFRPTDAPTPVPPVDRPAAPATVWMPVRWSATTSRLPAVATTVAPLPTLALVSSVTTLMATLPATPVSLPPAAARPQARNSCSPASPGRSARTSTDVPRTSAPLPTWATLLASTTFRLTAAPTLVSWAMSMASPKAWETVL